MTKERDPAKLRQKLFDHARELPFFKLMGYEVVDFGPGWSTAQIRFRPELANPNGVLHGGVIATLIDAGTTQAMLTTEQFQMVRDTRGIMTTIDLRVKYLRPVSEGVITCESKIPHLGRRIAHAQSVVTNEEGKEIAIGDATLMIIAGKG